MKRALQAAADEAEGKGGQVRGAGWAEAAAATSADVI
jgi:hypothetical protein